MKKVKVLIDCDPGVDDAYALMYAFASDKLDILQLTSVSGNIDVETATKNIYHIQKLANKNYPIYMGAKKPIKKDPIYAKFIHGGNGLKDYQFKDYNYYTYNKENYLKAYRDTILNSSDKVVVVATGPLTNIANLLIKYPEVKENIAYISIMGGGLKGGNHTVTAEFNIFIDPLAAKIVFESNLEIVMAGLDVTEKTRLDYEFLMKLRSLNKQGLFLYELQK